MEGISSLFLKESDQTTLGLGLEGGEEHCTKTNPVPCPCDDGNPCTDDVCVDGGCLFPNNTTACDDGDACTENDACSDAVCAGMAVDCDDGDACTDDSCVDGACHYADNSGDCDDENLCTENDICAGGTCAGIAVDCDDGDICTTDACDPATGDCSNTNNTAACDDGNACTEEDACADGVCAGANIICPEGEWCVDGVCTPRPCVDDVGCDDGDACNGPETCDLTDPDNGVCVPGTPVDCDDADLCTTDSCDSPAGDCTNEAVICDPGFACDPATGDCTIQGKVYWTDVDEGRIWRADLDGTDIESMVSGLQRPSDVAIDTTEGRMYWIDSDAGRIQRKWINNPPPNLRDRRGRPRWSLGDGARLGR